MIGCSDGIDRKGVNCGEAILAPAFSRDSPPSHSLLRSSNQICVSDRSGSVGEVWTSGSEA